MSKMVLLKKRFDFITCSLLFYKSTRYVFKVNTFVTRGKGVFFFGSTYKCQISVYLLSDFELGQTAPTFFCA